MAKGSMTLTSSSELLEKTVVLASIPGIGPVFGGRFNIHDDRDRYFSKQISKLVFRRRCVVKVWSESREYHTPPQRATGSCITFCCSGKRRKR